MRKASQLVEISKENLKVLLQYKEYFEKLIEFRTKVLRNLESNISFEEMADDVEMIELKNSILDVEEAIEAQVAKLSRKNIILPFMELMERYELSRYELNVILLALMPSIDTSFRMKIARYKDNILFNYVDVDLVINVFFDNNEDKIRALSLFSNNSTLIQNRLIRLYLHQDLTSDELINFEVKLPERMVNFLLMKEGLGTNLLSFCKLEYSTVKIDEVYLPVQQKNKVVDLIENNALKETRLIFLFTGPSGTGKTDFAKGIAHFLDKKFLLVNAQKLLQQSGDPEIIIEDIFYEAMFNNAVLIFEGAKNLVEGRNSFIPYIVEMIDEFSGICIFTMEKPEQMDGALERRVMFELKFEKPSQEIRELIWKKFLPKNVSYADDVDIGIIAHQFDIPGGHIKNAAEVAYQMALSRNPRKPIITMNDIKAGAHAQLRGDLTDYSEKSKVKLTLKDLILPEEEMNQVKELLAACKNHQKVLKQWGFDKKLTTGKGIVALFSGEPGTGKTLCAEILANELDMELYQVSIPKIVSKWIGETEKNIAQIFSKARATHSMLLFDEADALFTSRVQVKTSTDRYSNLETNYLLQEIERYEGIVILTTNRMKDFDKAYKRRILFQIHFPFPKEKERLLIWKHLIPPEVPIEENLDFKALARNFEFAGGNIKNVILRAAYKAMDRNQKLNMDIIVEAAAEESKTSGKLFRIPKEDDF